jgi:hypothetical protein
MSGITKQVQFSIALPSLSTQRQSSSSACADAPDADTNKASATNAMPHPAFLHHPVFIGSLLVG